MAKRECVAMVLAGGQGSRLAALTTQIPKPAMPFGAACRLIDFSLSNCYNSGLDVVGIPTAMRAFELNTDPARSDRLLVRMLPPSGLSGATSYSGTANAIYENMAFIDQFEPEHVLILSGDHVYKMDYRPFIERHKETGADATIAVIEVPWSDASRFGIMATKPDGGITDFIEKPAKPGSNLASMGVYLFSWPCLKHYLRLDATDPLSSHDFGKNIIPAMLIQGAKLYSFPFRGYWRDVGTVASFYEAHMDLLTEPPTFAVLDIDWPIHSTLATASGNGPARLDINRQSLVGGGSVLRGDVVGSVIFSGTSIGAGAAVYNSVVMPGAWVGSGSRIENAVIGPGAFIAAGSRVVGSRRQPTIVGHGAVSNPYALDFGA